MRHQASGFNRDHTPAQTAQRVLSFLKRLRKDKEKESAPGGGWLDRLKQGLEKTRKLLGTDVTELFRPGRALDETLYEELETALLTADVGVGATRSLMRGAARARAARRLYRGSAAARGAARTRCSRCCEPLAVPLDVDAHQPFVIMLAGVNGTGKTTSIGKLAHYYQGQRQVGAARRRRHLPRRRAGAARSHGASATTSR